MRRAATLSSLAGFVALCAAAASARAEVTGVDIDSRADVDDGATFGDAGAYEFLTGRVHFAVDPANARNKIIVDLDKAPRNAAGNVELSADLAIMKPKDATKGNGTLLLDVVNRGNATKRCASTCRSPPACAAACTPPRRRAPRRTP